MKTPLTITWTDEALDKGDYEHYMRKEIMEQPEAIRRTLSGRLEPASRRPISAASRWPRASCWRCGA